MLIENTIKEQLLLSKMGIHSYNIDILESNNNRITTNTNFYSTNTKPIFQKHLLILYLQLTQF